MFFLVHICVGCWQVSIKGVCGGSEWNFLMLILTNLHPLALLIRSIIQMLMKCEPSAYCRYGCCWLHLYLVCFCNILIGLFQFELRSGSVCLDVINQTWSPMFGKHTRCLIRFFLLLDMDFIGCIEYQCLLVCSKFISSNDLS